MFVKRFFIIVVVLLFGACAAPIKESEWPAAIPPYNYFQDYYQRDPAHMTVSPEQQYMRWVRNFYLGSIYYRKGWLDVTREVLATLPDERDRKLANEKLYLIGKGASAEWAKDRDYRVINLRHIVIWGNAINESIVQKEQLATLDKILNDINGLLEREIKPSELTSKRYFPPKNLAADEDLFIE